jgi:hypothetical protein
MPFSARAICASPRSAFRRAMHGVVLCAAPALFAAAAPALGQDAGGAAGKNALALQVGALGLGLEYSHAFGDRLAFRGAVYGSQVSFDGDEEDIEYASDLIWDSIALGVDFHPGNGAFRLSGGYMQTDNRVEAVAAPTTPEEIGDTTYTPAQLGTLNGLVTVDDSAVYGGLGWDWSRDGGFGVSLDLGLVSQNSPVVELRATGTAASSPAFQQDLAAEEARIQEDLEDVDIVPYVTLGFVFRF